ncbi:response regulator [Undibacterium flavidum]|uniref:Response regulator n=1 Tax=Undibacterium flavidum TaxID=2762297 RepID=A0ABR6YBF0_9BURK|nr:response regulator [Undibacterium flavidum]MBC3873958.1 response regulator [Undibacterium flavidum]
MTQSTSMVAAPEASRRFILEMRGFSDAEKSMLSSTFRLTSRRQMCYVEADESDTRADIYLINADNPEALEELARRNIGVPNAHSPAVVIGRTPVETPWPFVAKPIHWMRLFENLDQEMQRALRERSTRAAVNNDWDGATMRRSSDQKISVAPTPVETPVRETVLVVDDSATVRAFMRIKLSPFQFDVDFAETGEQAIEKASAKANDKPYNCIFLDIMMPGIDGYEVCKRIKSNQKTKSSAVVMLTSKSSIIDKLRANWSGCDSFLSKPVSEDDLLATIAKFLPSARDIAKA